MAAMRRLLPFHERHPTLLEAAIVVGFLLFLAIVLVVIYSALAILLWIGGDRKHDS